jgi:hypothetical protein
MLVSDQGPKEWTALNAGSVEMSGFSEQAADRDVTRKTATDKANWEYKNKKRLMH